MVFPYDQTFPKLIIAKELLTTKVIKKHEESSYASVEHRLKFPVFQKLSDVLGSSLLPKTAKDQRNRVKVSIEEALMLHDRAGCQKFEELIVAYGANPMEFSMTVKQVFFNQAKA